LHKEAEKCIAVWPVKGKTKRTKLTENMAKTHPIILKKA